MASNERVARATVYRRTVYINMQNNDAILNVTSVNRNVKALAARVARSGNRRNAVVSSAADGT